MRVLILGGTKFTGPFTVRRLQDVGHDVTVFHRGQNPAPPGVSEILGDKADLPAFRDTFAGARPDVVLNMVCYTTEDARTFVETFRGLASRAVVASSADVYRGFGCLHGTEPEELCGEPVPDPLSEDSPLRTRVSAGGEAYDKPSVERIVANEWDTPTTVLRLPGMYGPGDPYRRLWEFHKRMSDGRPVILLQEDYAAHRFCMGYAEDMGLGIALAVTQERAAGRTYNLAEAKTPSVAERARMVAEVMGWRGEIIPLPKDRLPAHLRHDYDLRHHMGLDTTRIREELGYEEVVTPEEAVRRAVEWEQANPPEEQDPAQFDYEAEDRALSVEKRPS